uniref:Uncharacterized protein n=1 Tax=Kalanchoe fedtschenkoi TaxID=63787 RepID=A0A7N0V6L0_KALFE
MPFMSSLRADQALGGKGRVLIFGASGFTGEYVLRALNILPSSSSSLSKPKPSLAALSPGSPTTLTHVSQSPSSPLTSTTSPLSDRAQLRRSPSAFMVSQCCKLTSGLGFDYVDICGESEFMERMEVGCGEEAVAFD